MQKALLSLIFFPVLLLAESPNSGCYKGSHTDNFGSSEKIAISLSNPSSKGTVAATIKSSFFGDTINLRFFTRSGSSYLSGNYESTYTCDTNQAQIKRLNSSVIEFRRTEWLCACAGGKCFKFPAKIKTNLNRVKNARQCNY